jgi:hypothetical protein
MTEESTNKPAESMIERVAMAMYEQTVRKTVAWEYEIGFWKTGEEMEAAAARLMENDENLARQIKERIPEARASISALRNPTEAMIAVAATGLDSEGYGITRGDAASVWQVMIDTALNEGEKGGGG